MEEEEIKNIEYLILLILGKAGGKISVLHLQKIFFILWKFHPQVKNLVEFAPHLKGPYSSDVEELMKNPHYLEECWEYVPPNRNSQKERIEGGYLKITKRGENLYEELIDKLLTSQKEEIHNLITAINLIVSIYKKLEWDELLLLLYTDEENKEFSKKSALSDSILKNAEEIIDRLIIKGIIPEEKREKMAKRVKKAVWLG